MIPDLDPNTRYEFVVRLHLDQISSPWSSVVYHQTLPAGNESIRIHLCYVRYHADKHKPFTEKVFRAPTAPQQPPTGVRVTLIEDDTALVSWREPEEPSVVVTHYTILYASQKAWLAGKWQIMQREGE